MDSTDDLLAELLARPDDEWRTGLEAACRIHPARAAELRRRFAHLERCGVATTEPAAPPASGELPERFGPYRLLRRLGDGGMGTVWLALHEALGREVAIKMIRPERFWFDNARERFQREVEAVARLRHPGCVQIHQVGEVEGVPYFAMDYVAGANCEQILHALRALQPAVPPVRLSGNDLSAVLRQGGDQVDSGASELFTGPWVRTAVRIALAATEALAHAHARGVVHRDLKPSNLMVTPEGRVVVIDFGLAVAAGTSALTREGSQLGSLPYMAPEQLRGANSAIGVRTDVYALGVCLYELLALAPPFPPQDEQQLRAAILASAAAPLRDQNPMVSRDLAVVVARAMHVDPEHRYASALELAADLTAVLEDRAIQARRDALPARLQRWARQRPALATAIGLLLLAVLLVPTAISLAIADQRDRAQTAEREARQREYIASISAAGNALLAGNGNEARLRLDACASELRGFEWRHLSLALDTSFLVFATGTAAVTAVAVNPGADLVAAGTADGRLSLYALGSGQLVRECRTAGTAPVAVLGFDAAGTELFAVDAEQTLRVYDAATGQLQRQRPRTSGDEHIRLPDPVDRLVVARGGGRLATLDAHSFVPRREVELALRDWPDDNRFLVRGNDLVAGSSRGATIWNSLDGSCRAEMAHDAPVHILGASAEQPTIAGMDGYSLLLWNPGEARGTALALGGRRPTTVLFLRTGRFVVAPCNSGEILVRDPETQQWRTLCGHRGAVTAAAIVPHTNTFVTGGADGTVRWWSASASRSQVDLTGAGWGRSLAIDARRQLYTGADDAVVWAVNPETGAVAWHALHPHWVNALAVVEPDRLLVASVGSRLWFWSTEDGKARGELNLPPETARATRIAVAPSGPQIAIGGQNGHVTLVDANSRQVLDSRRVHAGAVAEILFATPRRLLTCGVDGAVFALDPTAATPPSLLCRTAGACRAMTLAGPVLYTSEHALEAQNGAVVERDARTGELLRSQPVGVAVVVMRVLDEDRLVVGTESGRVTFWDRSLLAPILDLQLFTQRVRNLAVDPRGDWVAAIGSGGEPKVLHGFASPGPGAPSAARQRLQVADLRDRIRAATKVMPWRAEVERTLQADRDLDAEALAMARSLVPPMSRWSLGIKAAALAASPARSAAALAELRTLSAALGEALTSTPDELNLLVKTAHGLVAIRLGEPQAALASCAGIYIDPTKPPTDNQGQFLPALHFVRGMAYCQIGDIAAARSEREQLAALVGNAFAAESRTHLFLRELDDALH